MTPGDQAAIESYYAKTFLPQLKENTDGEVTAESFVPTTNAARYLQAKYTTPFTDFDEAIKVDNAGDGSAWSATHAKYHPLLP